MLAIVFMFAPFFGYAVFEGFQKIIMLLVFLLGFLLLFRWMGLKQQVFINKKDVEIILVVATMFVGLEFSRFIHILSGYTGYDQTSPLSNVFRLAMAILFILFVKTNYINMLNMFFRYNLLIILASVLGFILLFYGVDLQYWKPSHTQQDTLVYYLFHPVLFLGTMTQGLNTSIGDGGQLIRLGGFSSEPGEFALILTYLVVLNEVTLRRQGIRLLLFCTGILTFSFGFFVSIIILSPYYLLRSSMYRPKVMLFVVFTVILLLVIIINSDLFAYFDRYIIDRFFGTKDGVVYGLAARYSFDNQWYLFDLISNSMLFGVGYHEARAMDAGRFLYSTLLINGFIGFVLVHFPLVYFIWKNKNNLKIFLFLALLINVLQRVGVNDPFYVMFYILIYYASFHYQIYNNNKLDSR